MYQTLFYTLYIHQFSYSSPKNHEEYIDVISLYRWRKPSMWRLDNFPTHTIFSRMGFKSKEFDSQVCAHNTRLIRPSISTITWIEGEIGKTTDSDKYIYTQGKWEYTDCIYKLYLEIISIQYNLYCILYLSNLGSQMSPITNNSVLSQVVHGKMWADKISALNLTTLLCWHLYD